MSRDVFWMQKAIDMAYRAQSLGEVPVGSILIDENQQILGLGWNQVKTTKDPTAHAEIIALRAAAKKLGNERLDNTTLYVTLEPCCMCAGALVHSRVRRLVFATRDFKSGAAGSVYQLLNGFPLNHTVQIDEGPMQSTCANLLTNFFQLLRGE